MSVQEYLNSIAEQEASHPLPLPSAKIREEIVEMCRNAGEPEQPPDLVARPCPLPAAPWHWSQLERLLSSQEDLDPASLARAAFHARWICSLVNPGSNANNPRVSIIIPVHNRAGIVGEAIESALAQTYHPVEVIVIDDGSTDDIAAAVEPFEDRILFARQQNRGASSARNHGVRLASGDYLHFLDSDNLLSPGVVDRWISACRYVGDAELSFCPVNVDWLHPLLPEFAKPPDGGPNCPTSDMMRVVALRHPFFLLSVLVARWVFLEVGGFDERLRWYEDTRFWFTVGLRGTRVIGLRNRDNRVRRSTAGLSSTPRPKGNRGRVRLLDVLDILDSRDLWIYLPLKLREMHLNNRWQWIGASDETLVVESRDRLLSKIRQLGENGRIRGLSPRPLLLMFAAAARESRDRLNDPEEATSFHHRFMEEVDQAITGAPPISREDVEYWAPEAPDSSLGPDSMLTLHLMAQGYRGLGPILPDTRFWNELAQAAKASPPGEPAFKNPTPPLHVHCDALAECLQQDEWTPWRPDKAAYHAAWILRLLDSHRTTGGPLVSLVLSEHNESDKLRKAVASCLEQTYSPRELIVIDDGSTEIIEDALEPWADQIRLIRQTSRDSITARITGVHKARGHVVHILDSGVGLPTDALEKDMLALLHKPDDELIESATRLVADRSNKPYPVLNSTTPLPFWVIRQAGLLNSAS